MVTKGSVEKWTIARKKRAEKVVDRLYDDIKSLRVQGAERIALTALRVVGNELLGAPLVELRKAINKVKRSRPTEPMMHNLLENYYESVLLLRKEKKQKGDERALLKRMLSEFKKADEVIADYGSELIKSRKNYFTHCHSTTVIKVFKSAFEKGRRFSVHNTETRPLFQGRITARELAKMGVKVSHFVDSAARLGLKDCEAVFLGADAILSDGKVVNKIGSELIADLADEREIPVYIVTSKWKYAGVSSKEYARRMEFRTSGEVWAPRFKGSENIVIKNPAFEMIKPTKITAIITEEGIMDPYSLVRLLKKEFKGLKDKK